MNDIAVRDRLQAMLHGSPFVALCGMSIAEAHPDAGRLVVAMPFRPALEHTEHSGQTHGGAIATLIDTAACLAFALRGGTPPPTVNMRTDFLRVARGSTLRAIATVRRAGRSIGVVDVEVVDSADETIALGRATFSLGR